MIPQNNWQNDPQFLSMDPQKQKILLDLANVLQGKKLTEALPLMLAWKKQMEQNNIRFTEEETDILTTLFTKDLSPAGRQQYEYIKPFFTR